MRLAALFVALTILLAPLDAAQARAWRASELDDLERMASTATAEGLPSYSAKIRDLEQQRALLPRGGATVDAYADALFHELANVYAQGLLDPAAVAKNWALPRPPAPDAVALDAALAVGMPPSVLLAALLPQSAEYLALRKELARLIGAGEDEGKIAQIRVNLERWRWLPRTWPADRIEVRIAEYRLTLFQQGATVASHKVIVGKPRTPTPVFVAYGTSLMFNPSWSPPSDIARNELLPRFRANPTAAIREGFVAVKPDGARIPPDAVDWRARSFPYRLQQLPGPANALGKVVLRVDDPYAIHLHDTPSKQLFARDARAFSHGCVRVENAMTFAAALLGMGDTTSIDAIAATGQTSEIPLAAPIPIYFLYFTTALTPDGSVEYLGDIYEADAAITPMLDHPKMAVYENLVAATCAAQR